jgi:hypothetical protein
MYEPPASNLEFRLWRAVVAQAVRDVYENVPANVREVIEWIDTDDYHTVLGAAEIDPILFKEELANLLVMTPRLRKKYGRKLRQRILAGIYDSLEDLKRGG